MPAPIARSDVPAILLVTLASDPHGPGQLAAALSVAGFRVGLLAPQPDRTRRGAATWPSTPSFQLPDVRSAHRIGARLARAMAELKPVLVVGCDVRAVACLQTLVQRGPGRRGQPDAAMIATLIDSLGDPCAFDALLRPGATLELARAIGLSAPPALPAATAEAAHAAAADLGWPVVLMPALGPADDPSGHCRSPADVEAALRTRLAGPCALDALLRHFGDHDWDPSGRDITVRPAIDGPAFRLSTVTWRGQMLAATLRPVDGTAGRTPLPRTTEIETAAARLVAATGASGFLTLTFVLDRRSGAPVLVSCTPCPDEQAADPGLAGALAELFRVQHRQADPARAPAHPAARRSRRDGCWALAGTFFGIPSDPAAA